MRALAGLGLLPMLALCLLLFVVVRVPVLASYAVRQAIGPVDTQSWLAFAPVEGALTMALSLALIAPILAATVARGGAVRTAGAVPHTAGS